MDKITRNDDEVGEEERNRSETNNTLLSDFAVTKRQSRSLYRNWAVISKKSVTNSIQPPGNVFFKISTSSITNDCVTYSRESSSTLIEDRADEIVRHIEQNLLVDNLKSSNRIETLREMTEYLTLKRSVKKKLNKSIGTTNKTLSFSKRLKYKLSICFFKIPVAMKHFFSSFELWYSSLKVIEGHFGSNVASYFKFLRKLLLLNACIFILMFFFVMTPQLLFRFIQYVDEDQSFNSTSENDKLGESFRERAAPLVMLKPNPYEGNDAFRLGNIFTGEGFLTNTILFYGYYANTSLQLIQGYSFSIPASYFFTSSVCYAIIFFFLFTSVAVSYRKCYIETSGRMRNTFTNKVFCGWDFGIATKQAADLKSKSIYIDIKELLDALSKPKKRRSCVSTLYTTAISFSLNGLLLFLLVVGGMYSWKYLDQQMAKADTATTMMMWLILTLVIAVAPVVFSFITHLEGFESPSTALYMTLIRTFTLYAVVIAVVVAYRLNRSSESDCWETILGQDMFRLVVLDFIFGSIGTALSEFIRYRIFIKMWKGIGCPEFDIARSTMNLVYNQTLFYIGLFFSPVLSLLITVKLFIIFYVKKWGAIYNCRPFMKHWKASQAYTVYLSIAFLAFFCVVIAHVYIMTSVKTSNCGPFRGRTFMYESVLEEVLSRENSTIITAFYYVTRPGVVGIALVAMLLGVYYMREVALARIHVVKHLRHLLRLKAEDRKLLLNEISKYTKRRNEEDDDSENPECTSFGLKSSSSRGSLPEDGKQERLLSSELLTKGRPMFSSMKNVYGEDDARGNPVRSSSIYSSSPNVRSCDVQENVRLKRYGNDKREHENVKASTQNGSARCKYEDDVEEASNKRSPEVVETSLNVTSHEDQGSTCGGGRHINFNPVFTESVPFYLDEEDEEDDEDDGLTANRTSTPAEERGQNTGQTADLVSISSLKNQFSREERMPSRISFVLEKKRADAKRKK